MHIKLTFCLRIQNDFSTYYILTINKEYMTCIKIKYAYVFKPQSLP